MTLLIPGGALGGRSFSREAGGFVFSRVTLPGGTRLPRHAHARASLNVVLGGEYGESIDGRTRTHAARSVIVKPDGAEHSNQLPPGGARCLVVELTGDRLRTLREGSGLFSSVDSFRCPGAADLALRIVDEMEQTDAMAPLALEGLALEMVAMAGRGALPAPPARRAPPWIRRACELIHDADHPVTLSRIAAAVGLHPVYVARSFRRHVGSSVGEYARRLRLERARDELVHSEASISGIALRSGFADQSHFSRAFRRLTGVSPARYRRLHRG
ncbi:MAG TPA: AraC family transcriptional regulator [Longimicrobiaceae bacterium]|nr:AraC family transcriptional regulator [Longimicrobiaceae bacterium]